MEQTPLPFGLAGTGTQSVRLRCLVPYGDGEVRAFIQGTEVGRLQLAGTVSAGAVVEVPLSRLPPADLPTAIHFTNGAPREPVAPPFPIPDAATATRLMAAPEPRPVAPPPPAPPPPAPPAPPPPPDALQDLTARVAELERKLAQLMAQPAVTLTAAMPPSAMAMPTALPEAPPAAPTTGTSGDVVAVPSSAPGFSVGWHARERDRRGAFRWMGDRAQVLNPSPGRRLAAVVVEVAHEYEGATHAMAASFDSAPGRLESAGGGTETWLRFVPQDGPRSCDGVWLSCRTASSPARDGISTDERLLSIAVQQVRFEYA